MITPGWEHFEHKADIGVRGYGNTLAEAFAQTALALSSVVTDLDKIEIRECITVECKAPDYELLLVDWLNELVYQMATRKLLFSSFKVQIHNCSLQAKISGERIVRQKHQPAVEIKGATFTELKVYRTGDCQWIAQCVIDV